MLVPSMAAKHHREPRARTPQPAAGVQAGVVAAAAIVLGVFIVWLCAEMAIDPQNRTYLLTIGAGMAGGILALAVGSTRPRRSRRRARVATPASRLDDRSEQTVRSRPRRRRARS